MNRPGESHAARERRLSYNRTRQTRAYHKKASTPEGREEIRKDRNDRNTRVRRMVADIKVARGCLDCGFNAHPAALHFDHRPGEEKIGNIATMQGVDKILAEIEKCDVRCANCHAIKTHERANL